MTATAAPRAAIREGNLRVGCSGWLYRDWRGLVYPAELKTRKWFAYYTTLFPFELTTDWTYVRFHGPDALNHRYLGRYTGRRLRRPAERLEEGMAGRRLRRVRLLQQRLRGPRRARRPVAGRPAGAGVST